jgi:hypothetical protein
MNAAYLVRFPVAIYKVDPEAKFGDGKVIVSRSDDWYC